MTRKVEPYVWLAVIAFAAYCFVWVVVDIWQRGL
jgi:hypothetical protein